MPFPTPPPLPEAEAAPFSRAALPSDRFDELLARLDRMEARMARLEPLLETLGQAPAAAALAVDVVDDYAGRLSGRGIDVEARLARLLGLAERLTDSSTADALEAALALAQQAPAFAAMLTDIVDEQARRLQEEGIDVEAGFANGARAALRFGALIGPREIGALQTLLASEALHPDAVAVVSAAAQALVECRGRARGRVGPLGLVKALREPDVQRALDFAVGVARRFGAAIESGPPSAAVVRDQASLVGPRAR